MGQARPPVGAFPGRSLPSDPRSSLQHRISGQLRRAFPINSGERSLCMCVRGDACMPVLTACFLPLAAFFCLSIMDEEWYITHSTRQQSSWRKIPLRDVEQHGACSCEARAWLAWLPCKIYADGNVGCLDLEGYVFSGSC